MMYTLAEIAASLKVSERRVRLATIRGEIDPCRYMGTAMVWDARGLARIRAQLAKPLKKGGRKPCQTAVA